MGLRDRQRAEEGALAKVIQRQIDEQGKPPPHKVAADDQARARFKDMARWWQEFGPQTFNRMADIAPDRAATVAAVVTLAMQRREVRVCPHFTEQDDRRRVIDLTDRVAYCEDCPPPLRLTADEDGRCDICNEQAPENRFMPMFLQVTNNTLLSAMVGRCCREVFKELEG